MNKTHRKRGHWMFGPGLPDPARATMVPGQGVGLLHWPHGPHVGTQLPTCGFSIQPLISLQRRVFNIISKS